MNWRFTLTHQADSLEISEMDGWKGAKIKLERDPEFMSLIEHYEGSAGGAFVFYGDNGVVNGGVNFLKDVEETFGFDANIDFLAEFAPDDITFQQIFTGLLDLSAKNEMKDNKMQVPVIRDDFWTRFKNRIDTPVSLSSTTDLDGNAVEAVVPIDVDLTSQQIRTKYEAHLSDAGISFGQFVLGTYYQMDFNDVVVFDEINEAFILPPIDNIELPASNFTIEYGGTYSFDIRIAATNFYSLANHSVKTPADLLDFYIQFNNQSPIAFSWVDVGTRTIFTFTGEYQLTVSTNIRIYGQAHANDTGELIISGGDSIGLSGPFQSYLNIIADTVFPDTQAQGYLIHDLIHGVLARLGLGTDPFYSEFLGSTLTNAKQYDADGCGWMYVILKGLQIRQYTLTEKPFFISFKQIWDGINPILNLGLGYETLEGSPDHQVVRIEQKAHFLDDAIAINFGNVREINSSYDQDMIFKTIKTGYKKWQSENISGIDDPQTKHTYNTRFEKVGKELNLESDFIAAGLAIETTRRTTREKSADYKYDNDNFIIALNTNDVSPDRYAPELDENFDSITGLINSDTRYNLILTPLRTLLRWANYIGGCLQSYTTSVYKFASGEGNYDLVSDYSCASGRQCQAIICDSLSEKEDISLTSYNSTFGYFFVPLVYDITIPMEFEEYETIRDNPKKAIGISQTTTNFKAFKIKLLDYDIVKGQANIKAWPKVFFPIEVIDSIPEMDCVPTVVVPVVYDEDYQAILDYGTAQGYTLPSTAQQVKQNQYLLDLKSDGIWDGLDVLYVLATDGDSSFAKINWKNPGTFNATDGVAPTFTANEGFTGNAVNMYLTSGWDPATNGVNYTLDECGIFCHVNNETAAGNKAAWGFRGNGGGALLGQALLLPEDTTNAHTFSLQNLASPTGSAVSSKGFYHIRRVADNDLRLFKNGSQVGATQTTASDSLSNQDAYILALNVNGAGPGFLSDSQVGVWGIGASLTGKESALYTAWNTYLTSL